MGRTSMVAALLLGLLAPLGVLSQLQTPQTSVQAFNVTSDIPSQRQALLELLSTAGNFSDVLHLSLPFIALSGLSGDSAWGTASSSYCRWWGVTCCSTALTEVTPMCSQGPQSVSGLDLSNTGLIARLPDVFGAFPDLQTLDVSANRGLTGTLPRSIGALPNLWRLDTTGTSMDCTDKGAGGQCPLPSWLMQTSQLYYASAGLWCPEITFVQPRQLATQLAQLYGTSEEVEISSVYYHHQGCQNGSAHMFDAGSSGLSATALIIIMLVPALAVSAGLALLSIAVMRYLGHLKASHDAIHLTEAWKRRNPPGVIVDGNDKVLRQISLVITDVEGSTELWEWDYGVMTLALEVHDNILRGLISRYCGYEVTTEGDSFTIAFHDACDATAWALHVQTALLNADWPEALLAHPRAATVYSTETDSSRPGQLLFRGLRVRAAINTGIPMAVHTHELTSTLVYAGPVTELAASMSDLPSGGQVLIGPTTFASISSRLAELGQRLSAEGAMPKETQATASKSRMEVNLPTLVNASSSQPPLATAAGLPSQDTPSWWQRLKSLCCTNSHAKSHHSKGSLRPSIGRNRSSSLGRRFGSLVAGNVDVEAQEGAASAERFMPFKRMRGGSTALLSAPWVAAAEQETTPIVIDMGSHWLDGQLTHPSGNLTASYVAGVRVTQVVMRQLAPRATLFPQLQTARQLHPSYFEAPSAADALLPDGLRFNLPSMPIVTIAFCGPEALRPLELLDARAAKEALAMYCSAVRATLGACSGYECQEKDGVFMLAFHEPASAVEWGCLLQLALLRLRWSRELLSSSCGEEVVDPDTDLLLFRGVRARVGVYRGDITRIIPHRATGRADFFGPCVNRAARFLSAAAPGQVLVERGLAEEVMAAWQAGEQAILDVLQAGSTLLPEGSSSKVWPLRRPSAGNMDVRTQTELGAQAYDHQASFDRATYGRQGSMDRASHASGSVAGSGHYQSSDVGGNSFGSTSGRGFGGSGFGGSVSGLGRQPRRMDVHSGNGAVADKGRSRLGETSSQIGVVSEATPAHRRPSSGCVALPPEPNGTADGAPAAGGGGLDAAGVVEAANASSSVGLAATLPAAEAAVTSNATAGPLGEGHEQQALQQQQQQQQQQREQQQQQQQQQQPPAMFQRLMAGLSSIGTGLTPNTAAANTTNTTRTQHNIEEHDEPSVHGGSAHSGQLHTAAAAANAGITQPSSSSNPQASGVEEGYSHFAAGAEQEGPPIGHVGTKSRTKGESFTFAATDSGQMSMSRDASLSLAAALGSGTVQHQLPSPPQQQQQQQQSDLMGQLPASGKNTSGMNGWGGSVAVLNPELGSHPLGQAESTASAGSGIQSSLSAMGTATAAARPQQQQKHDSGSSSASAEVSLAVLALSPQQHQQQHQQQNQQHQQQQHPLQPPQQHQQASSSGRSDVPSTLRIVTETGDGEVSLEGRDGSMTSPFAQMLLLKMEEQEQQAAGPLYSAQQDAQQLQQQQQQQQQQLQQQQQQQQQGPQVEQLSVQPVLGLPSRSRWLRNQSFCMADDSTMEPSEAYASFDTAGEEIVGTAAADAEDISMRSRSSSLPGSTSAPMRQRLQQALRMMDSVRSSQSSETGGDTPRGSRLVSRNVSWARGTPLAPMLAGADSGSPLAHQQHGGPPPAPRALARSYHSFEAAASVPMPSAAALRMHSIHGMPRNATAPARPHAASTPGISSPKYASDTHGSLGSATFGRGVEPYNPSSEPYNPGSGTHGRSSGTYARGAEPQGAGGGALPGSTSALPATMSALPFTAGAVPLEAIPGLRLRMSRRQSFMLHAMTDAVQRRRFERAAVAVQMHDMGCWTFKGIMGQHDVVQVVPAPLVGRLRLSTARKSGKAVCQAPGKGLVGEVWVALADLDTILYQPLGELGSGNASVRYDRPASMFGSMASGAVSGEPAAEKAQDRGEAPQGWEHTDR